MAWRLKLMDVRTSAPAKQAPVQIATYMHAIQSIPPSITVQPRLIRPMPVQ